MRQEDLCAKCVWKIKSGGTVEVCFFPQCVRLPKTEAETPISGVFGDNRGENPKKIKGETLHENREEKNQ
ncbi:MULTISPECIES: hypothetical protein [unclassified Dehalobacter]|uniref:hypothetical protein n=1 Tax=unclassified Dehalobacter TaxID=2635733 RepID=UPI0010DFA798|nr:MULTISPECIES: hypothetical protein [unclassified Dehalobacter]TCX53004.1 hypothetical protein C1I38_08080 [Dehalobacter sp. 12DCB1]